MKKILCLLVIIIMIFACSACAQNNTDIPNDSIGSTQSDGTQNNEQDTTKVPGDIDNNAGESFSILNLNPTNEVKTDLQFTLANGLGSDTDFSVLNDGHYSYMQNSLPCKHNSWKELKKVQFKEISKNESFGCYTISIMKKSDTIYGLNDSYITCVFDVSDENMTVGKAYEENLYYYIIASEADQYFSQWMNQLAFDANCETALEAVVKTLGMPSSVHYTDCQNHATFDIVYKMKDKALIFTGYEKFEDYTSDKDRLVIQYITISGINSTNYIDTIAETDTRINLK